MNKMVKPDQHDNGLTTEASKLLESALKQMDGIISGKNTPSIYAMYYMCTWKRNLLSFKIIKMIEYFEEYWVMDV